MQPKSYKFEVQVENPEESEISNDEKNMPTLQEITFVGLLVYHWVW